MYLPSWGSLKEHGAFRNEACLLPGCFSVGLLNACQLFCKLYKRASKTDPMYSAWALSTNGHLGQNMVPVMSKLEIFAPQPCESGSSACNHACRSSDGLSSWKRPLQRAHCVIRHKATCPAPSLYFYVYECLLGCMYVHHECAWHPWR